MDIVLGCIGFGLISAALVCGIALFALRKQ